MQAFAAFSLFGFGKSKRKEEGKGSGMSGLRAGISDEVHGGHLEGNSIVLADVLGGGSYPAKEAGPWVEEGPAGFRLVFQPMDMMGRKAGPLMVSTNLISRQVMLSLCGADGLSGMLSAYVTGRGDAEGILRDAGCASPIDYPFTADLLDSNFASMRRRRWDSEKLPGPMCLYGSYICRSDGLDDPGMEREKLDFTMGLHEADGGYLLSSDLGGVRFNPLRGQEAIDGVEKGEIRALVDPSRVEGGQPALFVSDAPIPRDVAISILTDIIRCGVLNVYTPDRSDAEKLIQEAGGGRLQEEPAPGSLRYLTRRGSDAAAAVAFRP